ncbi:M20/M25/M40 family metallo-hydrolase [Amycolatopsis sp. NPDC049253]|uniref:M20/M25/M40 family metallo-hydrolase n=1 Tax=Amycolatopsis sp. NPDC049253 TaxID=3155274 RepID=UPI00341EBAE3
MLAPVAGCSAPAGNPASIAATDGPAAQQLKSSVTDAGVVVHLQALQRIADENGGNRASPGPGYDANVDYVAGVLRASGYEVDTPAYEGSRQRGTMRTVLAQTRTGSPGHVVVVGAHLDSVTDGPGIVDNGSGVAALLEIARCLGPSAALRNTVRFAFFGSEEDGSQGAKAYVTGLSAEELGTIMLYLNVDMIASPNGGYFAQGGVGADLSASGPAGSATVAGVLAGQLRQTGVQPENIEFVGDDESAFVEAGIPSGGAENGDHKRKSAAQAQAWGGAADERFDPCYHRSCDRLDNVNRVVLSHYLAAIAGTVAHFAMSEASNLR